LHLGSDAFAILQRDQVDQLLLGLQLVARDVQPRLQAADRDISVGGLRRDREPGRGSCCCGRLPIGAGGITRRILAAEEVQLPARADAKLIALGLSLKSW
jgi:hypothetical protein